jgi:uncharacterized iron-regulated membrane protein
MDREAADFGIIRFTMNFWQRWLRQPQSVWIRKAIFQVHLWTGIGLGIYVIVVCVTGSLLVFRPELSRAFSRGPLIVAGSGTILSDEELKAAALRRYPGYEVTNVFRDKLPNAAVDIWMDGTNDNKRRLFDPFTGEDLGRSFPFGLTVVGWLLELHDNLLTGENGRLVNGVGGLLLTMLALTGVVIWWPGIKNWRRSLMLQRGVNWKRFTWDLHSAVGFWTGLLVFMFAFTGFYLVFQEWFTPIIDYFQPYKDGVVYPRRIDDMLAWLPRLHFGRFRGIRASLILTLKILWVILGLAPAALSVTGGLMWWNRVVRKAVRQSTPEAELVQTASLETVSMD